MNEVIEILRKEATEALNKVPREPYNNIPFYNALARFTISIAIDAVILRKKEGKVEVLLKQRSLGEVYPGQWHCPGTVLRTGEEIASAFARLEKKELGALLKDEPVFVSFLNNLKEERGHFIHLIFLAELDVCTQGEWFSVDKLPEDTIENHKAIVRIATKKF